VRSSEQSELYYNRDERKCSWWEVVSKANSTITGMNAGAPGEKQ